MKIELHGNGFEAFVIPRYVQGLEVDNSPEPGQYGKYPVKAITGITVLTDNYLYVAVDLRADDEHLPVAAKEVETPAGQKKEAA